MMEPFGHEEKGPDAQRARTVKLHEPRSLGRHTRAQA